MCAEKKGSTGKKMLKMKKFRHKKNGKLSHTERKDGN